jgi:vacuolar protein sorting-associated protein 18
LMPGRNVDDGTDGDQGSLAALESDLRAFLSKCVEVLDPATTAGLLADAGRMDDLAHWADCRGDQEAVLEHLVSRGEAQRAFEVLRRPGVSRELAYKFAPALAAAAPEATVRSWIEARPPLDPRRLLPALLHLCEGGSGAAGAAARGEALRYARHCLRTPGAVADPAVHDFAVALLTADESK